MAADSGHGTVAEWFGLTALPFGICGLPLSEPELLRETKLLEIVSLVDTCARQLPIHFSVGTLGSGDISTCTGGEELGLDAAGSSLTV